MIHTNSDSDITSLDLSSPRSSKGSKRPVYYVQSPSEESHDGDKSSTLHATTIVYNSPMGSPSHPSSGRNSRVSSASRFSGFFRSSSGPKGSRKRNQKDWTVCNVIEEEGSYDHLEGGSRFSRYHWALTALSGFVLLFTVFSLIIWGANQPYKPEIVVKTLAVSNFNLGEGSDYTGVPTKMLTMNCSLQIGIYNPATLFGIHISSTAINLIYSEIPVATGQLKKYYQPRKSHRAISITLQGNMIPLYGAGASLAASDIGGRGVPLRIEFGVRSQGDLVGKLVRIKHRRHISCPIVINALKTKPVWISKESCTYN